MTNKNELYHYGVKGMRWGQKRALVRAKKEKAWIEGNDRRVATYGKKYVKDTNKIDAVKLGVISTAALSSIGVIGAKETLRLKKLGYNRAARVMSGITLGALGTGAAITSKGFSILRKDNALTDQYDERHRNVKRR